MFFFQGQDEGFTLYEREIAIEVVQSPPFELNQDSTGDLPIFCLENMQDM